MLVGGATMDSKALVRHDAKYSRVIQLWENDAAWWTTQACGFIHISKSAGVMKH